MNRIFTCIALALCACLLFSCAQIEALFNGDLFSDNKYNSDVVLTSELESLFRDAYYKAALPAVTPAYDINQIQILNYYGTIGETHVVRFNKACPGQINHSEIEDMDFRGYTKPVYLINNGKLYTIKNAYDKNIINFDDLCLLFGINFSGKDTFSSEVHEKLRQQMKSIFPEEHELYEFLGYYGEYNGYSVVTYSYNGMQPCVTATEICNGLAFEHGYETSVFRVMNGESIYSLNQAFENGILTLENVLELHEIHTGSAKLSESLLDEVLSSLKKICDEYPIEKQVQYNYWIYKYYGQYGDVHIIDIRLHSYFFGEENVTAEDLKSLLSMYGHYVFDGDDFYTLDKAVELGLITEEIKSQIK